MRKALSHTLISFSTCLTAHASPTHRTALACCAVDLKSDDVMMNDERYVYTQTHAQTIIEGKTTQRDNMPNRSSDANKWCGNYSASPGWIGGGETDTAAMGQRAATKQSRC